MYNLQLIENRIMSIAKAKGLSKNKLLINANLSKSVFDNMKKGQIPSVDKIHTLADYLDCSVDYLLGRTDESSLSGNVIGGDVTGGTVVQGTHHSSVSVHNGGERVLSEECAELVRIYESLSVRQRIQLLKCAFEIVDGSAESCKESE